MFSKSFKSVKILHKNESGQAALETAIILIAFVVVASVFAFAILSAGSASTDKGKQAINAGLQGVQSSMSIKGSVTAKGVTATSLVTDVIFDLALVAGGSPVDLTPSTATVAADCGTTAFPAANGAAGKNSVVISYRDGTQTKTDIPFKVCFIGQNNSNDLLEAGEVAEVDVVLPAAIVLKTNTAFTIEIKPQSGSVIKLDRTTPAAISTIMELN